MKACIASLLLLLAAAGAEASSTQHRKLLAALKNSGPDSFQYAEPADFRRGGINTLVKQAVRDSVVGAASLPTTADIGDRFSQSAPGFRSLLNAAGWGSNHNSWHPTTFTTLRYNSLGLADAPPAPTERQELEAHTEQPMPAFRAAVQGDKRRLLGQQSKGPDSWMYAEPSDYRYGGLSNLVKDVVRSEVVAGFAQHQPSAERFEQPPPALRGDRRLLAADASATTTSTAASRRLAGSSGPDSWQYGEPGNYRYHGLSNIVKDAVRSSVVGPSAVPASRFERGGVADN